MDNSDEELVQIYLDICRGFSEQDNLRLIHLPYSSEVKTKKDYYRGKDWALSRGLKPEDYIIDKDIKSGKWLVSKELHIKNIKKQIEALELSKRKIKTFDAIDYIYDSLEDLRKDLQEILFERNSLLINSAEFFANNYYNFYNICNCVQRWGERWIPMDHEYLDYCEEEKFIEIENFFYKKNTNLSYLNIKKICIQSFFYNAFNLSDNPFNFFNKPIYKMTNFQVSLMQTAKTFCKIIADSPDIPEKYSKNPDKVLMYWYAVQNGAAENEQKIDNVESEIRNSIHKIRGASLG